MTIFCLLKPALNVFLCKKKKWLEKVDFIMPYFGTRAFGLN